MGPWLKINGFKETNYFQSRDTHTQTVDILVDWKFVLVILDKFSHGWWSVQGLMNNFMSVQTVQFNENTCLVVLYFMFGAEVLKEKKPWTFLTLTISFRTMAATISSGWYNYIHNLISIKGVSKRSKHWP